MMLKKMFMMVLTAMIAVALYKHAASHPDGVMGGLRAESDALQATVTRWIHQLGLPTDGSPSKLRLPSGIIPTPASSAAPH